MLEVRGERVLGSAPRVIIIGLRRIIAGCVPTGCVPISCARAVVRGGGVSDICGRPGFRRDSSRGGSHAFRSAAPAAHVPVHDQLALVPADADEVPSVVGEAHDVGVVRDGHVVDLRRVGTRERDPRVRFWVDLTFGVGRGGTPGRGGRGERDARRGRWGWDFAHRRGRTVSVGNTLS